MQQGKEVTLTSLDEVPPSSWKKLTERRIYFGHQSVGYNIIDGLRDVMKEKPYINLTVMKTTDPASFNQPIFAHSEVGENTNFQSKCKDFVVFMEKGIGNQVDFAFFKFCYIDFSAEADVDRIFKTYKDTMCHLKKEYPKTTFIHITVPLVSLDLSIKDLVKKIMHRSIKDPESNIKRNEFNRMLRKEYEGKDPLFDLAEIESMYPDGTREVFQKQGKNYFTLIPGYTYDGGHLNEKGRKLVASQFLLFLVNLSEKEN